MIATMEQINEMNNKQINTNTKFSINAETMKGIKEVFKGHKNSTIPVLNYVLIEMVNDTLINVKYTNADLYVSKMLFANIEYIDRKEFLLPIEFFKSVKYIKKSDEFFFEIVNKDILTFTRNNLNQKVTLMDSEEYPSFNFLEEDKFDTIETSNGYEYFEYNDLEVLQKAIKSVSNSETRPSLREIHIKDSYVTSTDSHRLFRSKTIFKLDHEFMINPVLVQKAIDVCDKNMFLKMYVNNNRIKIQDDYSTKIYFNHHQGNYPDTSRIIPIEFNYEIEIDRVDELFNFIKVMKDNHLKFTLNVNENKITLESVLSSGIATMELPVRINSYADENFSMMFNSKFLKDGLEQLDKESFKMSIVSNMRPFILKKQKNNKEMVLLLPIRSI